MKLIILFHFTSYLFTVFVSFNFTFHFCSSLQVRLSPVPQVALPLTPFRLARTCPTFPLKPAAFSHVTYTSTLKMEQTCFPKPWHLSTKLHSITLQKIVIFHGTKLSQQRNLLAYCNAYRMLGQTVVTAAALSAVQHHVMKV
jgi:hypothetical protein